MKHMKILTIAALGFAVLTVIVLASGAAFAGSGEQRAEGTFGKGPAASSLNNNATGEFKLEVRRDRFKFEAKGEGIHTRQDITLCVGVTNIDTDNPEDRGRWELDEDNRRDLRPQRVPRISSGTEVTIRNGVGCTGSNTVILTATLP